ncbi:MAG: ABC transporter ATP-binding protein [Planctomycetota bacterium]|nr:MAG: ABC transporter ATP-binding protein [Planctomycetota bacterium]
MFVLENVIKRYSRRGKEVVAFRADHLEIAVGSYTAVVGPSGSGKTTLLSLLGGMLSPTDGRVLFDGASVYDLPISGRTRLRRTRIGFVFQTFNLVPYLSALENVQVPLSLAGKPAKVQRQRAGHLLQQVGLSDRVDHKPCELSTGQQQRVALARTLANDPEVILADEPTGNLDPESRATVLSFFDNLHRAGKTILMVTHDAVATIRASSRLSLRNGLLSPEEELQRAA